MRRSGRRQALCLKLYTKCCVSGSCAYMSDRVINLPINEAGVLFNLGDGAVQSNSGALVAGNFGSPELMLDLWEQQSTPASDATMQDFKDQHSAPPSLLFDVVQHVCQAKVPARDCKISGTPFTRCECPGDPVSVCLVLTFQLLVARPQTLHG